MSRGIIFPDTHAPYHDKRVVAAVLEYAKDHAWDWGVQLGDWVDNRALNPHMKDKLRLREGLRFQRDQEIAKELFGNLLQAVGSKKAAGVTVCKGNHEAWSDQYIDRHPELEGTLRPDDVFAGAHKILPYHRSRIAHRVGKLCFIHGFGRGGLGQVRTWLNSFKVNLVGGHLHRMEQVSTSSANGTLHAWCMGLLGRIDIGDDYTESPTAWQQGFGVAHVDDKTGEPQVFPVHIGRRGFASPEGRFYKL